MWTGDEKGIRELLGKWRGANAGVSEYVHGHGQLLIRVFRPELKLSLYILCKNCRTIKFQSMGWKNGNFVLREKPNPQPDDEDFKFEIEDGDRLYVACWAVYLLETDKPVFIGKPPESQYITENKVLV